MNNRMISVFATLMAISALIGGHQFLAGASTGTNRLAVIEDSNGHRIAVEPISDDVWDALTALYQSGGEMWIGGGVETFLTFRPDPDYPWGFRFNPETITIAEVTAEGLQTTIENISDNLPYWIDIGCAYVYAKVTDYVTGNEIQLCAQLSSDIIIVGNDVTISATVTDHAGNALEAATVTATIGDLEILFLLSDHGDGNYQGTINASIIHEGSYEITVSAHKEGYKPNQISLMLNVIVQSASSAETTFKAVVNEMWEVNVVIAVDVCDGVTREDAEQIAENTFIEVMRSWGDVLHRLDTLTYNDTCITAHYTWGVDENDMGHVFDLTADLTTLLIMVAHCR